MKKWIWICVAAVLAIGLFAGVKAYRYWYDHKSPNFEGALDVYVYPWMEPETVCDSILASGKVRKPASLRRVFKDVETLEVGHYRIDSTCTSVYVTRMLHKGWQTPVNLTLSGSIRTPAILARKIGAQMLVDSVDVASFIFSKDSLKNYGVDVKQLFTMVIPDTYQMKWTASVREIFDRFAKERDAWWTPERIDAAHAQGMTPKEASALASIVDGETRYVPEQPTIAGVYLNRLRKGMPLQADPTVAFLLNYETNRILKKDLKISSPYNTYINKGLPPGPINVPGKEYLEAVLNPDTASGYLFFCADPSFDGSHRFARTYSEHQKNARAFQNALNQRAK